MSKQNKGWTDRGITIQKLDSIVYIGRFQPPHLAHIEIMKSALEQADQLIVLVGSSMQPRTIKNPWSWNERSEMIYASLPEGLRDRVSVMPLRDITYNDQVWVRQVQDTITAVSKKGMDADVGMIGHSKDETSYYLEMFPQWKSIDVPNINDLHASDIREAYFDQSERIEDRVYIDGAHERIVSTSFELNIGSKLPTAIHDYLLAFEMKEEFDTLVQEYEFVKQYKQAWEAAPYAPTFVTVDSVVIQSGHVLLIRRRANPGKGLYALPGGFIDPGERIEDAAIRELREETKIKVPAPVLKGSIKKSGVYDAPERSLRGRTITHAFLIELPPGPLPKVKGGDDADKAKWVPLNVFKRMEEQMFEDHFAIINSMLGEI